MTPAQLAALHARCFTVPRPWGPEEFAQLLNDTLCHLDTHANGFVLGRTIAGEAEVLTIAVDPAAQGKGVGRSLMMAFERSAQARAATEAFLEVAADNAPARALYARMGFAPAGLRAGYYAGTDALILRKPL